MKRRCALFFAALSLSAVRVDAATFAIDDSGTVAYPSITEARWTKSASGRGLSTDVEATVRVDARLNLRAWIGRQARIYISSPRSTALAFRTTWTSTGQFLSGELGRNTRALVWTGRVSNPVLSDTLFLTLRTDGRTLTTKQALEFNFEIDVDNAQ